MLAQQTGGDLEGAPSAVAPHVDAGAQPWRTAWPQVVAHVGRLLAVSIPIVVAITGGQAWFHHLWITLTLVAVWYGSLSLGAASVRTTLQALGPGVGLVRGAVVGFVVSAALGAWVPGTALEPTRAIFLAAAIVGLAAAWETFVLAYLVAPKRVLFIGPREGCSAVIRELAARADRRFVLIGIVNADGSDRKVVPTLGPIDEMPWIVDETRPDLVALVPGCDRPAAFAAVGATASSGFRVVELAQFCEYAFGRVPVQDLHQAWIMSVLHLYQRPYSSTLKRALDLFGGTVLALVTAPLFPLLVLFVRLTPGPVFIRQIRIGEHGRPFTIYKFRTMGADAERHGQALWAVRHDPRVTEVGRLMRRFRLDELPQLWNVLRGEMSLVGPRPERPEFIEQLLEAVPFWSRRHLVKPGITGWAQVNRGYASDSEGSLDKLSYDLWYIRHYSFTVDLAIWFRTLAAVCRGEYAPEPSPVLEDLEHPFLVLMEDAVAGQRGAEARS